MDRCAWAHAEANEECVCTTPPIDANSRYRTRWVGVSDDGRSDPSTTRPSASETTTMSVRA